MEMRRVADLEVLEHYLQYYRFSLKVTLDEFFMFTSAPLGIYNIKTAIKT